MISSNANVVEQVRIQSSLSIQLVLVEKQFFFGYMIWTAGIERTWKNTQQAHREHITKWHSLDRERSMELHGVYMYG